MENPRPEDSIPVAKKPRRQEELPIDLVSLILLSLSVKTLSKFRCVCKPWYSLISSPQFQQDHYNRCSNESPILLLALKLSCNVKTNTITLLLSTYSTMEAAPLDKFTTNISLPSIHHPDTPIQSCRGLVCLVFHDRIFLCNPSTQELLPLPLPLTPQSNPGATATQELLPLPLTPQSNHCIGFGYAASTEDFKVVRFLPGPLPTQVTHCQVFTLGTRRWRQAKSPPPFAVGTGGAPFVRGAFHLLPSLYCTESYNRNISAFDVETEEYRAIRLPEYYYSTDRKHLSTILLTELGGSLCLTFDFITRLELWLLEDYEEWTRLCTVQTSNLVDYSIHCISWSNPLAVLGDERILINVNRRNWTTELLCYDPEGRVATEKLGEECLAAFYVESFFSLGTRILMNVNCRCGY